MSSLYLKTKSGNIFKVWSDNQKDETMDVYPYNENFDIESTVLTTIPYSNIKQLDSNLYLIKSSK